MNENIVKRIEKIENFETHGETRSLHYSPEYSLEEKTAILEAYRIVKNHKKTPQSAPYGPVETEKMRAATQIIKRHMFDPAPKMHW